MIRDMINLATLLSFLLSATYINSTEWTKAELLPESKAIIKTIAQIEEEAAKKKEEAAKKKSVAPSKEVKTKKVVKTFQDKHPIFAFESNPRRAIPVKGSHPFYHPLAQVINFTAATSADSEVVPPDAMGVVGPEQFILGANGRIRSFNKETGLVDHAIDISTNLFFSPVSNGAFTTDSRIRYDRFSDRWYLIILGTFIEPLRILLAMSDSGVITKETKWSFFFFEPYEKKTADYPTLGIDAHALYIGANVFGPNFFTSDGYVIPKSRLLQGTLHVYAFKNLFNPELQSGPTSPQGVDNFDPDATEGYFIGNDLRSDRLMLRRVKDPGGTPEISADIPIMIGNSHPPLAVPQKGSFNSKKFFLQDYDKRLTSSHVRDKSLYTACDVGVDNEGKDINVKATRNGCQWFQFDLKDPEHPVIVQKGILYQPSSTNDKDERFFWMPGVMTNGLNSLMLCCSTSGDRNFPDAAYAYRFSNDPLGTLRGPHLYTKSNVVYTLGQGNHEHLRWGEYSHSSVDPSDNMTFWNVAEYSLAYDAWGLQVIRVPAPPPAAIVTVNPAEIKEGQKDVHVKISGERVEGSAFYDPGEGYVKRLRVEIDDVKIESIKWISPTEIDLVVETVGTSTAKRKDIRIINPDGQMIEAKGLLHIVPK